jgi:hypothetical protein
VSRGKHGFIVDLNLIDLSTTRASPLGAAFSSTAVATTLTILPGYLYEPLLHQGDFA